MTDMLMVVVSLIYNLVREAWEVLLILFVLTILFTMNWPSILSKFNRSCNDCDRFETRSCRPRAPPRGGCSFSSTLSMVDRGCDEESSLDDDLGCGESGRVCGGMGGDRSSSGWCCDYSDRDSSD